MKNSLNICALIPAYNEEATIGDIIRETKKYVSNIYVVDNCSTDNTPEIAASCGAEVIDCHQKKGYGIAQYTGQQFIIEKGFDYILQLDADGQHDPSYIPLLLQAMETGNCDIVVGSRFLSRDKRSSLSTTRYAGIKFFSRLVSLLGGTRITDVTSGFKIYRVSCLKKLHRPCDSHPAVEQMLEIARKGFNICEVPINMPVRTTGKSHLNLSRFMLYPFLATWLIFKTLFIK